MVARIVCELCGSSDLIKQDGVFVCQSCGCKYSLEEARKMMGAGTALVEVEENKGPSQEYINLKKAMYEAMEDGRFDSAYSNSIRLSAMNPDDPELIAVQALTPLGKEKIGFDIPTSAVSGMTRFYTMVSKWKEEFSVQIETLSHVRAYVYTVCDAQRQFLQEEHASLDAQIIKKKTSDTIGEWGNALGALTGNPMSYDLAMNDDRSRRNRENHNRVIEAQLEKVRDKERKLDNFRYTNTQKIESMISEKKKAEAAYREQRKLAYWEEHSEQKAEIENKIKQLEDERQPFLDEIKRKEQQIAQIKDSVNREDTPLKEIERKMQAEIERLSEQLKALGFLKLKERKQLSDSISTLRSQLPDYKEFAAERNAMLEKLQPQIDAITIEIVSLKQESKQYTSQIADLQNELDRERE